MPYCNPEPMAREGTLTTWAPPNPLPAAHPHYARLHRGAVVALPPSLLGTFGPLPAPQPIHPARGAERN